MRKTISFLFSGALLATTLVGLVATPASAAPTLMTCTDLSNQLTKVLHVTKKNCKPYLAPAIWQIQQTDGSSHTGPGFATIRICSSKNPLFTYRNIKTICPNSQVTTDYWRTTFVPKAPIITSAAARGYDSVIFDIATSFVGANSNAPIAYFLVTNIKTGEVSKISPNYLLQLVISGLSAQTSYTFKFSSVSLDGISPISATSEAITTGAAPVVAAAPVASTTPAIVLSCADGGDCIVGSRGPGGGIVYFVSSTPFSSPGSTCNTSGVGGTSTCKYLEVAPSTWQSAGVSVADDSRHHWSSNTTVTTGQNTVTASTEGIAAQSAYERFNWKIGQGLYNTSVMKVSGETSTAQSAVLAYAGNSTAGQWFIPSLNELNELCKYARGQVTGVPTVACTVAGTIKSTANAGTDLGGFSTDRYWSSSEGNANVATSQRLVDGLQFYDNKNLTIFVRPIRAFGSILTDATLSAASTIKGQTLIGLGTPSATLASASGGTVTISAVKGAETSNTGSYITAFTKTASGATVSKIVKYSSGATYTTFGSDTAYNSTAAITTGDFFIVKVTAEDGSSILYYKVTVTVLAVVYTVGDTGPGGGKIFYVAATPFACGPTRAGTCTYLEAAPSGWNVGAEPERRWASTTYLASTAINNSGSPETATETAIGWGYRNTRAIILQGNTNSTTSAAALADSYTATVSSVVYDDWYLPSQDELNQMCKWVRGQAWISNATVCNNTGLMNTGTGAAGFVNDIHWSSSEYNQNYAYFQNFDNGFQPTTSFYDIKKDFIGYVRPVRAF